MCPIQTDLLRKLGILFSVVILALTAVSCGSDDPVAPPVDDPPTNSAPAAPTINTSLGTPSDGATNAPQTTTFHWSCSDPDGDVLSYDFHFSNSSPPAAIETDMAVTSYGPTVMLGGTTFYWQVFATDPDGETTASPVWSFTTVDNSVETISNPANPTGPGAPTIDVESTYTTSSAISSEGHAVEYQFNWGDGASSVWAPATTANHAWTAGGTFLVTAQARCVEHPAIISALSGPLSVTVAGPENITPPNAASGPTTGTSGVALTYNVSGAVSSLGHALEYRLEWEDGLYSTWAAWATGANHNWLTAGTYDVRVQARCQDHPDVESSWSPAITVVISDPAEIITGAQMHSGPTIGGIGDILEFLSYSNTSTLGHPLEKRYDWDDGRFSDWLPQTSFTHASHAWSAAGVFQVRVMARCIEHPTVESEWSAPHELEIFAAEFVAVPVFSPSEEQTIEVMQWQGFSVLLGSTSNIGHALEYQFDPGDGRTLTWNGFSTFMRYDALGDYESRVRARCIEHPDIVSDWSATTTIHVAVLEHISTPVLSGPATGTVGVPVVFAVSGAVSTLGHDLEYQLSHGTDYNRVNDFPQGWTTADNLSITWDSAYAYNYVIVTARCIAHPEVEEKSSYIVVNIGN